VDSLPRSNLKILQAEKRAWKRLNPRPWSSRPRREYDRFFTARVESWLDQGYGACELRREDVRREVVSSLRYFDTVRYILDEFAIMPNHIHVLVKPLEQFILSDILHSWKSYSATRINKLLGSTGQFWMDESFDHIVRDRSNLQKYRIYIRDNPRKGRLAVGEYDVGCGSGLR